MNAPIVRLFALVAAAVRRARVRVHVALDGVRAPRRCATTRTTGARCSRSSGSSAGMIRAADGTVLAAQRAGARQDTLRRAAIPPASCSPTRSATRTRRSGAPGLEQLLQRPADRPPHRARRRVDSLLGTRATSATTCARRSTRRPSRSPSTRSAGRKGAVVALDVKTGAVRVMASGPRYDPNDLDEAARSSARPTTRTRRCQPRHAGRATRRARR